MLGAYKYLTSDTRVSLVLLLRVEVELALTCRRQLVVETGVCYESFSRCFPRVAWQQPAFMTQVPEGLLRLNLNVVRSIIHEIGPAPRAHPKADPLLRGLGFLFAGFKCARRRNAPRRG